jgi:pimeloyl-ACP methyl ester carboxylesterase
MKHAQMPGQLVDIGGSRLHLLSMGAGSPTVILDAGLGGFSLDWCLVQPEIAKLTRVVAYDRAGLGWSDEAPAASPRTGRHMMTELHTLLGEAEIPGPYIFVGHSLGGLNARLYVSLFPAEVAGLVLVDATHEDELSARFPAEYVSGWHAQAQAMAMMQNLAQLGLLRLMLKTRLLPKPLLDQFAKLPPAARAAYEAFYVDAHTIVTLRREMAAMEAGYAEARQIGVRPGLLGSLPLAVVKHGQHSGRLPPRASADLTRRYAAAFEAVQAELAGLSARGRIFTAENSGHSIHIDQPGRVTEAICWVMQQAALAAPNGSCGRNQFGLY